MVYRSYAKVNLYLDVLDRRPDGYTDIETVFQTVSLCDDLHIEPADGEKITLTCTDPGLPLDEDNLVVRAALLLRERTGARAGARMHLHKRIPVAAGLAGGSGNAAAALAGLNDLWELKAPQTDLARWALELGSDVPYCLRGGTMAATGRGEELSALPGLPEMWLVLVHPPLAVSTRAVYASPRLERNTEPRKAGRTPSFHRALALLGEGRVDEMLFNRMESAVFAQHPELSVERNRLIECGCRVAAMSGSGPTLMGICRSPAEARNAARAMEPSQTSVVHTVHRGVERLPECRCGGDGP
jgi:4-diphosphocytidyl-2-C-methyl-D-erythritol kinase